MKAKSRFIMLFLSLLMVLTIPVSQTFSQGVSLEKDLQALDRDYETNLDLIKLQLDSQDMMQHYGIHKANLDNKYSTQRSIITSAYNKGSDLLELTSTYSPTADNSYGRYYLPNGGKITYTTNPYGANVDYYKEEFLTRAQTKVIINNYFKYKNLSSSGIINIIKDLIVTFVVPGFAGYLVVYEIILYFSRSTLESSFNKILKSSSKAMNVSTYASEYGGSSRVITVWSSAPYGTVYYKGTPQTIKQTKY